MKKMNEEWEDCLYELINEDYDIEDLVGVRRTTRENGFIAGKESPQVEISRLQKVLEKKNLLISDFMRYDEERKVYIRRLEKRIVTLRNKNQELNKRINK